MLSLYCLAVLTHLAGTAMNLKRFPYIFRSIEGVWISTKLFYIVGSLSLLSIITLAIEIAFYVYFKWIE